MEKKIKILVAKPGLDGHDIGAKTIAKAFRDAGMEVVYTGLRQTVDQIVASALQEDVDVIGLSILSGAHLGIATKLMGRLKETGAEEKIVLVGGVIPLDDVEKLKNLGIAEVFRSGARMDAAIDFVKARVGG